VCTLLANLGMGAHADGFRAQLVDGAMLNDFDEEDLQHVGLQVIANNHLPEIDL